MISDAKLKQLQPEHFHSMTEIMVRYRDLDTFNHVNNAVYFSYLESGRLQYNHKYLGKLIDWKERGFILGTNHMIYVHPLFLFDRVRIYTGVGKIGRRSAAFVNLLTNHEGVHVAYGYSVWWPTILYVNKVLIFLYRGVNVSKKRTGFCWTCFRNENLIEI